MRRRRRGEGEKNPDEKHTTVSGSRSGGGGAATAMVVVEVVRRGGGGARWGRHNTRSRRPRAEYFSCAEIGDAVCRVFGSPFFFPPLLDRDRSPLAPQSSPPPHDPPTRRAPHIVCVYKSRRFGYRRPLRHCHRSPAKLNPARGPSFFSTAFSVYFLFSFCLKFFFFYVTLRLTSVTSPSRLFCVSSWSSLTVQISSPSHRLYILETSWQVYIYYIIL